jgi:hypothetical protein
MTDTTETNEARPDDEELLAQLRALPRELGPDRDLWPEVRGRIAPSPARRWALPLGLAAAATAATLWVGSGDPEPGASPAAPTGDVAVRVGPTDEDHASEAATELLPGESTYLAASDELGRVLEARRGEMPGELSEIYDQSLALVDQAIVDSRSALTASPHDETLRGALDHAYRQKLDLLRQVTDLPLES